MQFAFALPESVSVAWGPHGTWLTKDDAFPADDPFVLAHLDMFSLTPSKARASDGRLFPQVPMSAVEPVDAVIPARGRRG